CSGYALSGWSSSRLRCEGEYLWDTAGGAEGGAGDSLLFAARATIRAGRTFPRRKVNCPRQLPVGRGTQTAGGSALRPPLSCRTSPPQGGRLRLHLRPTPIAGGPIALAAQVQRGGEVAERRLAVCLQRGVAGG